ncbi:MAG: CPBP family intramembrane glutamic endopeptidase [Oscillospiraceae bacterium]
MIIEGNTTKKLIISVISVYVSLIFSLILGIKSSGNSFFDTLFYYSLPIILGLVVFPKCMIHLKIVHQENKINFKIKKLEIICLAGTFITILARRDLALDVIIQTIVIALSEEFLFRYFLIDGKNAKSLILFSSLIFAFVAHGNEPLLVNLLLRLPLGLALGYIYKKQDSYIGCSMLHFVYNLILS